MNTVIKYDEKLEYSTGAFIKPDGEICLLNLSVHERFARNYCMGNIPNRLAWLEATKTNDSTVFSSSELSFEDLELFKLWLKANEMYGTNFCADFLVYVLGWDKVETSIRKSITTTSQNPHLRLYNYYLMDWNIITVPSEVYNKDLGNFMRDYSKHYMMERIDEKTNEEIEEIKAITMREERYRYFK